MEASAKTGPSGQADLMLIQKFINTWNIKEGTDELSSPQALVTWLSRNDLTKIGNRATEADLQLFLKIREGLRALAMLNNGESPDLQPLIELKQVIENQAVRFTVTDKLQFDAIPTGKELNRVVGSILLQVYDSSVNGTWTRLKACKNDACLWAFYDHSRNHSGKWCTMSVCGNRIKVRKYASKNGPKNEANN